MPSEFPKISVVIPAFNEARWIAPCLVHLKEQSYPSGNYEIIVVDNASTDGTAEIARANGARLLIEPRRSAYHARNLAIENSDGNWLAFTDADCMAEQDWLMCLWKCASSTGCFLVGGLTIYQPVNQNLANCLYAFSHGPEKLRSAVLDHNSVAGGNMFVNRQLFAELGRFRNIRSGSDIEFSRRAAAAGYSIGFAENAITAHQCDLSNSGYLKRTFRIRYGQAMHSERSGRSGFFINLAAIPWRPGFRVPRPSTIEGADEPSSLTWWAYCWLNRWMGFLGAQWAYTTKLFGSTPG